MPSIFSELLLLGQLCRAWRAPQEGTGRPPCPQFTGTSGFRQHKGPVILMGRESAQAFGGKSFTSRAESGPEDPKRCRWALLGLLGPISHLSPRKLVGGKVGALGFWSDAGETWKGSWAELANEGWGSSGTQPLISFQGPSTNPPSGLRLFWAARGAHVNTPYAEFECENEHADHQGVCCSWPALFGEGNGNLFQYSWVENAMNIGACQPIVHRVAESRTWLSDFIFFPFILKFIYFTASIF